MIRRILVPVMVLFLMFGCNHSEEGVGKMADNGMVVSAHPIASKVGSHILRNGGNAMDAAIATEFALAVTFPSAGNIGGGGLMVVRTEKGSSKVLDYREKAPFSATSEMYQDDGKLKAKESLFGHKAAGVPGTVAGMFRLHEQYGTVPMEKLLEPAIRLAQNGFPITEKQAARLNEYRYDFKEYSTFAPKPFLDKTIWREGDTLRQPQLALTLKRVQKEGRVGFYQGETAKLIVDEMERCDGLITKKDLKAYNAKFREPVTGQYRGFDVLSVPPPSSGGICLLQILQMGEHFPLEKLGFHSSNGVHVLTEISKRVYADRSKHFGDPDFVNVPIDQLLDSSYLAQKAESIDMMQATPSSDIFPGNPVGSNGKKNTTHYSIVDKQGNAVSATTTLNSEFGSKVLVGQAGFFLNNEMNDFSVKPGHPNQYGLIQGEKNAIEPGKRMLSSMTPTILEKDGQLFMVVGSPGGSTIISSVYQSIINVIVYDMTMQEAVKEGRFHHQWKPDYILSEYNRFLGFWEAGRLFAKGHFVVPIPPFGHVNAIKVNEDGRLEGAADPRGDNMAVGY